MPSGTSYACRIGVNVVFMAAFSIPVTAFTVFLVASSHMLSGLFALTSGGVGSDPSARRRHLTAATPARAAIAAFSITQDAILTIWNVVLGLAVMLLGPSGFDQMKKLLSKNERTLGAPAAEHLTSRRPLARRNPSNGSANPPFAEAVLRARTKLATSCHRVGAENSARDRSRDDSSFQAGCGNPEDRMIGRVSAAFRRHLATSWVAAGRLRR